MSDRDLDNQWIFCISSITAVCLLFLVGNVYSGWSTEPSKYPCGQFTHCFHDTSINGTTYPIRYEIFGPPDGDPEGLKLISISENAEFRALDVLIESNENGTLWIKLQHGAISSLGLDPANTDYVVIVDGQQVERGIAGDENSTILTVKFTEGAKHILIGDANRIPEFGPLVMVIAPFAIIGAVIVGRRSILKMQGIDKP